MRQRLIPPGAAEDEKVPPLQPSLKLLKKAGLVVLKSARGHNELTIASGHCAGSHDELTIAALENARGHDELPIALLLHDAFAAVSGDGAIAP
jgi:hypothetical protein